MGQVKSMEELGDHITSLCRLGAPGSGVAEDLFDKHTLGDSAESSASGCLPTAMGVRLPSSAKQIPFPFL